jgi:hypothetical protein
MSQFTKGESRMRTTLALLGVVCLYGCGGGGGSSPQVQTVFHKSAHASNAPSQLRQRCREWCWAACAEAVDHSYGAYYVEVPGFGPILLTQDLLAIAFAQPGQPLCSGAKSYSQIAASMTSNFTDVTKQHLIALQGYWVDENTPQQLVDISYWVHLIEGQHPFILAMKTSTFNHAVLVVGMEWDEDASGNILRITAFDVADPWDYSWPGSPPPPFPSHLDLAALQALDLRGIGIMWTVQQSSNASANNSRLRPLKWVPGVGLCPG